MYFFYHIYPSPLPYNSSRFRPSSLYELYVFIHIYIHVNIDIHIDIQIWVSLITISASHMCQWLSKDNFLANTGEDQDMAAAYLLFFKSGLLIQPRLLFKLRIFLSPYLSTGLEFLILLSHSPRCRASVTNSSSQACYLLFGECFLPYFTQP